ncbi:winged helix-turn-helix transcriptional regulator [Candidatus Pacearchaeota archaeon]|nr:winged helix-turn-helix transcriptional regulator [Candidatus Pacearchaeota archaeon]
MLKRKKKIFDGIDKEIIRLLLVKNPLSSRQIAINVGLTPSAISPRLNNLKKKGILVRKKISVLRCFNRRYGDSVLKIKSPRCILWDLDIKDE